LSPLSAAEFFTLALFSDLHTTSVRVSTCGLVPRSSRLSFHAASALRSGPFPMDFTSPEGVTWPPALFRRFTERPLRKGTTLFYFQFSPHLPLNRAFLGLAAACRWGLFTPLNFFFPRSGHFFFRSWPGSVSLPPLSVECFGDKVLPFFFSVL